MEKHIIAELLGVPAESIESTDMDELFDEQDTEDAPISPEDPTEAEEIVEYSDSICLPAFEYLARETSPRDIFLQNWLERESITMLGGEQKAGKSILSLNMSLCLASGKDFLGFRVPKPRKALLCQQEISVAALKERLNLMSARVDYRSLRDLLIFEKPAGLLNIMDSKDRKLLIDGIADNEPDIVIFDPLSTFHHLNENDEQDMASVLGFFSEIAKTFKIGVLIIHHFAKPSAALREKGYLLRGHSILGDRADSIVILNKLPAQYKNAQMEYPWECYAELQFKLRNDAAPDNVFIARDTKTLWYNRVDFYGGIGRKITPEDIRETVRQKGGEIAQKDLEKELAERVSRIPFYKAVKEAKEKGYIEDAKIGGRGNPVKLKLKSKE